MRESNDTHFDLYLAHAITHALITRNDEHHLHISLSEMRNYGNDAGCHLAGCPEISDIGGHDADAV
jgi:hypothetical protein